MNYRYPLTSPVCMAVDYLPAIHPLVLDKQQPNASGIPPSASAPDTDSTSLLSSFVTKNSTSSKLFEKFNDLDDDELIIFDEEEKEKEEESQSTSDDKNERSDSYKALKIVLSRGVYPGSSEDVEEKWYFDPEFNHLNRQILPGFYLLLFFYLLL